MSKSALIVVGAIVVSTALLGGCGHVAPYEREYLARPSMDTRRESDANAFNAHVLETRQGATVGAGHGGGGCGCN